MLFLQLLLRSSSLAVCQASKSNLVEKPTVMRLMNAHVIGFLLTNSLLLMLTCDAPSALIMHTTTSTIILAKHPVMIDEDNGDLYGRLSLMNLTNRASSMSPLSSC